MKIRMATISLLVTLSGTLAWSQALGDASGAHRVTGDPGVSSMVVIEQSDYRALRDYIEPGATRRMHSHDAAKYQVFVLLTGRLRLTIEGEEPLEVAAGDVLHLEGGARHTFTNTGDVTATIVEVFGRRSQE